MVYEKHNLLSREALIFPVLMEVKLIFRYSILPFNIKKIRNYFKSKGILSTLIFIKVYLLIILG